MAGQLVQVATETVTSAVASVTLTGIDSDDVYMVALNNVTPATDNRNLLIRVTESGTPNTTANYDESAKFLDSTTTFGTQSNVNQAQWTNSLAIGNSTSEQTNGILYLYNFNNASEYSFYTKENTSLTFLAGNTGYQGGGVFTSTSSCNGLQFLFSSSSNIASGTFTLYRVV